jgi:hypothetical protein
MGKIPEDEESRHHVGAMELLMESRLRVVDPSLSFRHMSVKRAIR